MSIFTAMLNIRLSAIYLWHRIRANNRHGLHSPFVYRLVDKVIYDFYAKNAYRKLKSRYAAARNDRSLTTPALRVWQLFYRLVADASPATYLLTGGQLYAWQQIIPLAAPAAVIIYPDQSPEPAKADLIVMAVPAQGTVPQMLEQHLPHVHVSTMLVIPGIYQCRNGKAEWQQVKNHPRVTVTIDLFWLQLVFFREGQVKEHFRVKY